MAANYGLAALSGILSGLGGIPQGMFKGQELDQRQQQIDEQKRQFDVNQAGIDTTSIGIPGRTPRELIPYLAALGKQKEETTRKAELGQGLAQQLTEAGTTTGMAPGASLEMPPPGALMAPPAAAPMPTMTQRTVDPRMASLARFIPQLSQLDPAGASKLVGEQLAPEKAVTLGADQRLVGARTGKPIGDQPTPTPFVPPVGMELTSVTKGGQTWKTPGADKPDPKADLSQAVRELLRSNGIDPLKATPQEIDAAIRKVEARLDNRSTLLGNAMKPPDAGTFKEAAQQNEMITLGQDLLNRYNTNPSVKAGLGARLGEKELPLGIRASDVIGPTMTSEQLKWQADVATILGTYRQLKAGLAVTDPEARFQLPIVPLDVGAVKPEQIAALVDWAKRNKTEMDRALLAAKKLPTPPPQAPPTPAPPAGAAPGGGKVRVIAPDGTPGTWDLSRGPIPPGFKQRP